MGVGSLQKTLGFLLAALLGLGLASQWIAVGAGTGRSRVTPPPEPKRLCLLSNAWTISDFDGDQQPDLAISRVEGHRYTVETRLSSRRERNSFHSTLTDSELVIAPFACDVDQDNDMDLVIVSGLSLHRLAVWFNDGHGYFEPGESWSWPDDLWCESPSASPASGDPDDQVCLRQGTRFPVDEPSVGSVSAAVAAGESTDSALSSPPLPILTHMLTARDPPLNSA